MCVCALAACGGDDDADDASAPETPVRWVSAGDSFASGIGLEGAAGQCGTSPNAFAPLAEMALRDELPVAEFSHVACSASVAREIQVQIESAPIEPNLVTFTAGGNDIGFGKVLLDCIGAEDVFERGERGCDVDRDEMEARIEAATVELEALYRAAAELVGPDGAVVVLDYPQLIEDPDDWPENEGASCGGVRAGDVRAMREVGEVFNDAIAETAAKVDRVYVVPVADTFAGHGVCGSEEPWLNDFAFGLRSVLNPFSGSFHPNELGYGVEADLLEAFLRDLYNGS